MRGGLKLIGVSMLANPSSEIIVAAAAMLGKEMRASDIQKIVFPQPTVGEVIRGGAA
jgi:dihydrolipoamide dehydrogenase